MFYSQQLYYGNIKMLSPSFLINSITINYDSTFTTTKVVPSTLMSLLVYMYTYTGAVRKVCSKNKTAWYLYVRDEKF